MVARTAVFALSLLGFAVPAVAQDAAAGAAVFRRCAICHTVTPGRGSTIGPHLNGVVGRKAGSVPGYRYSTAMAASKLMWDRATLDRYLTRPATAVPGTKMAFAGLSNPAERANLIAYLATQK